MLSTDEFILQHRLDDVQQLALRGCSDKSVDLPYALDQIAGWQTARKKLPTWAATDGIIYPPHLNMEQCSSEKTGRYKANILYDLYGLSLAISEGEGMPNTINTNSSTEQQHSSTSSSKVGMRVPLTPSPLERAGERPERASERLLTPSPLERAGERLLIDLTGGFGVDFSFMSRVVDHAVYVERNERLCAIAKHNFKALGLKNVEVVCGDGVEYLKSLEPRKSLEELKSFDVQEDSNHKAQYSKLNAQRVIFLDPARRDANGHKVFGIEDCTPDVLALKDELLAKADLVMIKLSPMLDWHAAVKAFGDCCREVHIVSVDNECKELLLFLSVVAAPCAGHQPQGIASQSSDIASQPSDIASQPTTSQSLENAAGGRHKARPLHLVCVNNEQIFETYPSNEAVQYFDGNISNGSFLFVPNASIMKAGCFAEVAKTFNIKMLDVNSHLFVGTEDIKDFPGRRFAIVDVTTMNKKELKAKMADVEKANISVRNFPLSAVELRKRLKVKDGGDVYLFATTVRGKHIILITRPVDHADR